MIFSYFFILVVCCVVISKAEIECTPYQLPSDGSCSLTINWRVRDNKEALATCLEYFPTTFVTGTVENGLAKCTVKAAYQCLNDKAFLMFDKCYYFPKDDAGKYLEGTIDDYTDTSKKVCGESGKIPVFYSYTHAKFVGMKAKALGLGKIWLGITRDGKEIQGKKELIHSQIWKLVEDEYWDGDTLKKCTKDNSKNLFECPKEAEYIFMRTRTDHVKNKYQGNFEQATKTTKASIVCENEANYLSDQQWYCDKLKELNLDSAYDKKEGRCLYISANKYTYQGKNENIKDFKGCRERPSVDLHSSGLDDGTAASKTYSDLSFKGNLRLAGYLVEKDVEEKYYKVDHYNHIKCTGIIGDIEKKKRHIKKWRHIDHYGKIQHSYASKLVWKADYPLNECSDFPGDSTTLGLKKGELIDLPPEVRAHAVCSIKFFQQCGNKHPCDKGQECTNKIVFNPVEKGFYECKCPASHSLRTDHGEERCRWDEESKYCARMKFIGSPDGFYPNSLGRINDDILPNDKLIQVVVRDGCTLTVRSHLIRHNDRPGGNPSLLQDVPYGTYEVPNVEAQTLSSDYEGLSASSAECSCEPGLLHP